MDSNLPKAAVLRMEGTNNDSEALRSLKESGLDPVFVHIHEIENRKVDLEDFQLLFIPGGFSAGDYVRAGVIFAIRLKEAAGKKITEMAEEGKPVLGTCNGFQVISEMGLASTSVGSRDIALDINESGRFECRTVLVKYTGKNKIFDGKIPRNEIFEIPVAHREGRVRFRSDAVESEILGNKKAIFTYVDPEGGISGYPWNPNGSPHNIAGISGQFDNVMGLMPHPERMFYNYQLSTIGQRQKKEPIGKIFFKALSDYARRI